MEYGTHEHVDRPSTNGLSEDIRGVLSEIERRLDRLRSAHADRERERAELESREQSVESRAAELEAAARSLSDQQAQHERALASARARLEELDQREAQARELFAQAKARHDDTKADLARQREQLEGDQRDFEAQREEAHALAARAAQQLKDLEEDRAALEATAHELDERQKDLDQQAGELAKRLAEADRQREALEAKAQQLRVQDQKLAELARRAAEQREQLSGDTSDLEQQKQWLAEQTRQADLLRARVAHLEAELESARQPEASEPVPLPADEALSHELAVTREKLRDAAGIIAQLREQLDHARASAGKAPKPAANDEHIERRKRRLAYVRDALRDESMKVAKAGELLRQRTAAMASQPSHAAPARASDKPGARPAGRWASLGRMGMGMAGVAAGLALLAGVSWMAAGEFSVPTYAAGVTVAHEARGREVLAEDLAGWQAFHESLLEDPRFYEFAAERMRQRGLLTLGDAVSVKNFMESSVSWHSGRDGELALEVRERGAGRARRVAETLAIALAGQANTARERRPDGLPSIVSREAAVGDRALDDQRPIYAGGIMAGLTVFSLALSGLVSSRVGRLRERVAAEGRTAMDDMGEEREGRIRIG